MTKMLAMWFSIFLLGVFGMGVLYWFAARSRPKPVKALNSCVQAFDASPRDAVDVLFDPPTFPNDDTQQTKEVAAFLMGAGSVLDMGATATSTATSTAKKPTVPRPTPCKAITGDWERVGLDWSNVSVWSDIQNEVYLTAVRVFGTPDKAKSWLNAPRSFFNGRTPQQVVDSGKGQDVIDLLLRLEAGVYQ